MRSLTWISPRDMRKNRAVAVRVMLDCWGFSKLGVDVTLLTPYVHRPEYPVAKKEIWRQYGLRPSFRIVELPTFYRDVRGRGGPIYLTMVRAQKLLAGAVYAVGLAFVSLVRPRRRFFVAHCLATSFPIVALSRLRILRWNCFLYLSPILNTPHERWLARRCAGVLVDTHTSYEGVVREYGIDAQRVFENWPYSYAEVFDALTGEQEIPRIEHERGRVVYVGKVAFPPHPEIALLVETARLLPDRQFVLVGGNGTSEQEWAALCDKRGIGNITWLGFQPLPSLLPIVRSADVLVSYYSSADPLAEHERVPAKYALYRCAGKPIIAPDFPGIREVLGDDEAWFVAPDRPEELARVIEVALTSPEAEAKGRRALERARENGITRYCADALDFMERVAALPVRGGRTASPTPAQEGTAEP